MSKTKFLLAILALCVIFFSGCIGQPSEKTVTTVAPTTMVPTVTDCGSVPSIKLVGTKEIPGEDGIVLRCMSDKILSCEKAKLVWEVTNVFRVEGKEGDICKLSIEKNGEKKTCKFKIADIKKIFEDLREKRGFVKEGMIGYFVLAIGFAPEGDTELTWEDGETSVFECDRGPMT